MASRLDKKDERGYRELLSSAKKSRQTSVNNAMRVFEITQRCDGLLKTKNEG